MVINVSANTKLKVFGTSAVCLAFGVTALIEASRRGFSGGGGLLLGVVGAVFTLLSLFPLRSWKAVTRTCRLIVDSAGVHWDDPEGQPWSLRWDELSRVAVTPARNGAMVLVRVDLFPADQRVVARHPELMHLWELEGVERGYRFPLGPFRRAIPRLDRGLQDFGPGIYRGVRKTQTTRGLT
ncbi:hypothetical protein AQ490_24200 [Wenjunlia vitaminophila]|uniref:Uncharacterized protein n=1 Tax=Wenjunlia vitaminophila TaxID=76728 RepID=A0A0T6LRW2_WENVI|nr:hypothetical protein AQ490_24200 [Wenjunlia vitaminophila]